MTQYRLYFHDATGHFMRAEHVEVGDDDAALAAARQLDHSYCIEVWDKARQVGLVSPGEG